MRQPSLALALAALGTAASASAATLKGVVLDAASSPVANAVVHLSGTGMDTTDAQGRFSFSVATGIARLDHPGTGPAHYVPGQGVVVVNEAVQVVRIDVLDYSGKVVATPQNAVLSSGTWAIGLGGVPRGQYLCRVRTGGRATTFRLALLDNRASGGGNRAANLGSGSARALATTDTLITTKAGYKADTSLWVEKASDSVTIVLQDTGATSRSTSSFDAGWLFHNGDASGADKAAFSDGSWRSVNVPFDWSIEGPYDQNAVTGGYGGYLPTGIGWFRKHFTLPANLAGKRVFLEFDGIMARSSVYLNGTLLGSRPNGYVSIRYEITGSANFGATENVLSVKADNSLQMASRWYAGAGIYRHVRMIVTDPVHFDKWSTIVTTPTTSSVHVATTVVNQGTAAKSVAFQATLVDPSGTRLAPVTTAEKSVPAGGSASFSVDIPVSNAQTWSLETPNMYSLVGTLRSSGTALDEEITPFGIRTIEFNPETGFLLNGKNVKMKGVCLHHDLGGLGAATPLRAWQRRLAVLKSIGVNAIRTSHNAFDPAVLDLMDRMGFLVMEEFFDVWTGHKYSMAGDYATDFKQWYQTDLTDIVKRDRNHPGIVIYSIGNEIRDALATRLPYTTTMVNLCHSLDATRPVTQALFRPKDAGDYPGTGGTIGILDVFGVNYRNAELLEAITGNSPHKSGISTEMGMTPSLWNSFYTKNPQVVGEFIWTGAEYLGEADGAWPIVVGTDGAGAIFGLVDKTSEIKDIGYQYAAVWAANVPAMPKTSMEAATKLVLTVDHPTIATDFDDIAYVRATFQDASGNQATTATGSVTFQVSGTAGSIVAVDNANPSSAESYRGNVRKAYNGFCYAMIQMKSAGSVTITATSGGMTSAPVTVTGTAGAFKACAGSCD